MTRARTSTPLGRIIRQKVAPPAAPTQGRLVRRKRIANLLRSHIDSHRVVCVYATAGAGKTTALLEATEGINRAWLTVDATDAAPGRLLTYLQAALCERAPEVEGVATAALAMRVPHAEAAGMLADAVQDRRLVLVLDELERLIDSPAALDVLSAFIRHAPPSMSTVVVSRRDLPIDLVSLAVAGEVASVGESDLVFTVEEAVDALERIGGDRADAADAVAATGGWVTGVLFEAWRHADHVPGIGGEADPLHGYLSSQILSQLTPNQREFLIDTSLLDEVTASRAEALGQEYAAALLWQLHSAHLPVMWEKGGTSMRCHARFREFLMTCAERRGARRLATLRRGVGKLLVREQHHEEAVEQFLLAGAIDEASEAADRAIEGVIERLDFDLAEHWLEQLHGGHTSRRPGLASGELMLSIAREDYRRGVHVADRLAAAGERDGLAAANSLAAGMIAWCYFHAGRVDDSREVLQTAEAGTPVEAMRYCLTLVDAEREGDLDAEWTSGGPFDALVMRVHLFRGRLMPLTREPTSAWAARASEPWRIAALRAMGETQKALALYRTASRREIGSVWLQGIVGAELMLDLGRVDDANRELTRGRERIRQTGSVLHGLSSDVLAAKLALRGQSDSEKARKALARVEAHPGLREYPFVAEQAHLWMGLVLLRDEDDELALQRLRKAVDGMSAGDRLLELPAAAVYLSEAEWRAGNESQADQAADLALDSAALQGSNHALLEALDDFPAVLSRRLDAEPDAESPWHAIARSLRAQQVPIEVRASAAITLQEFGEPALLINAKPVDPGLTKSMELLAYLASRRGRRATRAGLLDAIFAGRTDASARSYLRTAISRLREALPEQYELTVDRESVALGFDLLSESMRFESLIAQATRLRDGERSNLLREALMLTEKGPYLAAVKTPWAEERREELRTRSVDARLELSGLAYAAADYEDARRLAESVVGEDPFREAAWRLLMRVDDAVGEDDAIISDYRRCEAALIQLGTQPSTSTKQLLDTLRR